MAHTGIESLYQGSSEETLVSLRGGGGSALGCLKSSLV